jgi:hypothetical protein
MPNVAEMAHLGEEISVPYEDGKFRKLDLSHYKRLVESEEGPRGVVDGDREELTRAAMINELPTLEERTQARLAEFKNRGKGAAS